ncbi:MAG: ATP-binding cassette domain-containing protein [Gammaproteobacteria bacterium]|nr:ATP-binding cassette domain-containing protein [Gammaproteobacteria bacterium]
MGDSAPAEAVVDVRELRYAIEGRPIFDGLNLAARRGQITAVMGPSGTGKTTLLRLLMGAIRPDAGRLSVFGDEVAGLARPALYRLRRRIGMLFQNGALMSDLSVFENVAFPLRAHTRLPEPLLRRLVLMKLQAVGLRGAADMAPGALSGGMARRVALARAIVMDPELLIYDEPFVGLDPISLGVILRLIGTLNATLGITSIVVTHDVEEISRIAHQSYLLASGRAVAAGSPAELRAAAAPVVNQFMQGLPDGPVPFHVPAPDYRTQLLEPDA